MKKTIFVIALLLPLVFAKQVFAFSEVEIQVLMKIRQYSEDYVIDFDDQTKTYSIILDKETMEELEASKLEDKENNAIGQNLLEDFNEITEELMTTLSKEYSLIVLTEDEREEIFIFKDGEVAENWLLEDSEESPYVFLNELKEYFGDFRPKDVSDETINSIVSYNDYIIMYVVIIEDYYNKYLELFEDTGLFSQEDIEKMKEELKSEIEIVKNQYGVMGHMPIQGKEMIVEMLISYRDGLNDYIVTMKEYLGQ
ncbi:hypothetical protein ACTQ54_07675 [Fundicoccus sp. Sow4_H7]|uniref:hypothetical protein n=1 Tax=Fundicoccus sp. Sow4_H7 TaxID=3438784 RepID=UPI003F8F4D27